MESEHYETEAGNHDAEKQCQKEIRRKFRVRETISAVMFSMNST